ncbi:hypothetical protein GCM10011415_35280 [Salipiger pallidus]|uniref:Uncharacterized protein n=1 Tax=Salipiger pallidus TaxID=1775170 RepID=A0A8J3EIP2_9RHOB|nr:hypothetical protein [Salipiger pallidus]GGG82498.1 hypothetical protein GCM10011415_35280 [Salipiger pallidus]
MDKAYEEFDRRQRKVASKHSKLAQGYVTRLNPKNGTIEHQPIRRVPFVSMKGFALATIGFFCFKAVLVAKLGLEDYAAHLDHLSNGTLLERMGAWVMSTDPATFWIASQLGSYIT